MDLLITTDYSTPTILILSIFFFAVIFTLSNEVLQAIEKKEIYTVITGTKFFVN